MKTLYVETLTVEGELPVIKLQASEKDKINLCGNTTFERMPRLCN